MKVLIAITSCDFFDYTARAIRSALAHTPGAFISVIDDASPTWPRGLANRLPEEFQEWYNHDRVGFSQFEQNFGLTRSWNHAVTLGVLASAEYTVISNNDVIFTPGWFEGIEYALNNGYQVASPVTNAPGPTAKGLQDISRYCPEYQVTDRDDYLAWLAKRISHYKDCPIEARVNGYCWAAKSETWHKYAYAEDTPFNLQNTHSSKGVPNSTPTMTLMEDEYQHRMYLQGGKSAVCPGSFVFHYRSVWRGEKYKQGKWFRPEQA